MRVCRRFFVILVTVLLLLGCSLSEVVAGSNVTVKDQPVEKAPAATQAPTEQPQAQATPTTPVSSDAPLDLCTLVTKADAEKFFGEASAEPVQASGACAFTSAKDGLYALSVSAGQNNDTVNIMQSQAMLLGMAGVKLDAASMEKIKKLATDLDFTGFFTELTGLAKSSSSIKAQLFSGGGNDITYWAWISVPPRKSGAFAAVRGKTMVSLYLVVPESQSEEAMLNEANQLSSTIFGKLPQTFKIASAPAIPPTQAAPPTSVPATPVPAPTATIQTGLPAPVLTSPQNGAVFTTGHPRTTNFAWQAVPGASLYIFELMACSNGNPNNCFVWPADKPTHQVTSNSYSYGFVGAQPGKWRVTAVDTNGIPGKPSEWWTFKYTK